MTSHLKRICLRGYPLPVTKSSSASVAFGDGDFFTPRARHMNVPVWVAEESQSGHSQKFIELRVNIDELDSKIGLIISKPEMQNFDTEIKLQPSGCRMKIADIEVAVKDVDGHITLCTGYPEARTDIVKIVPVAGQPAIGDRLLPCTQRNVELSPEQLLKIHLNYNCCSKEQLRRRVKQAGLSAKQKDIDELQCHVCQRAGRPMPRPTVALPHTAQPGACSHMDFGDLGHHKRGHKLKVLVLVDEASDRIAGDLFDRIGGVSGADVAGVFLHEVLEIPEMVVVDLGSNLTQSHIFRSVLDRLGVRHDSVPREAHWGNKAEKAIDLVRNEMRKVASAQPALEPRACFHLALKHINRQIMSTGYTRDQLYFGRPRDLSEVPDYRLAAPDVENLELNEHLKIEHQLDDHLRQRARASVLRSLRANVRRPTVSYKIGQQILYWKVEKPLSNSYWSGPVTVIGQWRRNVLAWDGRHTLYIHGTHTRSWLSDRTHKSHAHALLVE